MDSRKIVSDHENFMAYTSRVFAKTADALPAVQDNSLLREKVASSIDYDKVQAMNYLYKTSSSVTEAIKTLASASASGAGKVLNSWPGRVALIGGAGYLLAKPTGKAFAAGAAEASEEKAKEWYNNALIAAPAAILALGGAAKAGLFGEKVENYADSVTDKVINLFGKKDASGAAPLAQVDTSPTGIPYKLAVAKTFSKLKKAEEGCTNDSDLEKIAEASDECAKLLFDCVFYL
tara:strand:- start:216 stop:917 length:702 start_codon:yes stop_codon:yes gene_type:complete